MSWLSDGWDALTGLFDSGSASNVASTVGDAVTENVEKGTWDKLGDALLSPTGLSTVLTTGLGLYKGLGELDLAKQEEEARKLADKNNMLLAMAKIKAGSGGGGGGGGNSRLAANQAIIDAIRSGYSGKQGALNSWANNYLRAFGK